MKRFLAWILPAVLLLTMAGCGKEDKKTMTMGTGHPEGIYYSYGGVLGQQIKDNAGVSVTVKATEGSRANIEGMASGEFQMSILQSDVMSYAWQGRRDFEGARVDSLRAITALYTEPVQLISVNPEIHYCDELQGMRISLGAPGSGIFYNAMDVLDAVSLTLEDIQPRYYNLEETLAGLQDGSLDAAFIVSGTPMPALQNLKKTVDFRVVPIEGPVAERILTSCSFYEPYVIPAGTYENQPSDVRTLGVRAVLVVSADESKDTVYNMTRAIFENLDAVRSCNTMGKNLSADSVAKGVSVPFHPGAEKYFREMDISLKP